ncbi:MAG: protein kinase [Polyangiaceae bacterium]|nr:protein kinase [Polyangiaceae bacterium]
MSTPLDTIGLVQGETLAGKYRIDEVLGVGGMGLVVAAHHVQLDERVAIKFLLPSMLTNQEAVARFTREARAAVKIKSEHVVRISDVANLDNGTPYMVMEYLQGSDLGAWLKERGALPVEQAVEFVLQACEAIAEAHVLGIVHRDLKPMNLFVIRRPDGMLSVKVLDFGISKVVRPGSSASEMSMTRTSTMMGSPLYMSPEQLHSSKDVDSRTDIWALGVILYELVTREPPFFAEGVAELVTKILTVPPAPLRSKRPDVPAALEAVVLRCLEKDRTRRFESVGELAGALQPFSPRRARLSLERISGVMRSAGLSASVLAMPPSSDSLGQGTGRTQGAWGRTSPPSVTGRRTLLVGVLLAALAVGAYLVFGQPGRGGAPAASQIAREGTVTVAAEPAAADPSERTVPGPIEPARSAQRGITVTPAGSAAASATPATSTAAAVPAAQTGPARTEAPEGTPRRQPAAPRPVAARPAKPRPKASLPAAPKPQPTVVVKPAAEKPRPSSAFDDRQ